MDDGRFRPPTFHSLDTPWLPLVHVNTCLARAIVRTTLVHMLTRILEVLHANAHPPLALSLSLWSSQQKRFATCASCGAARGSSGRPPQPPPRSVATACAPSASLGPSSRHDSCPIRCSSDPSDLRRRTCRAAAEVAEAAAAPTIATASERRLPPAPPPSPPPPRALHPQRLCLLLLPSLSSQMQ